MSERLLVMTVDELATGYRLAGAETLAVADSTEAGARLAELLDDGAERGVIAVHEPFYTQLDPALRRRAEQTLPPLVVALPAGEQSPGSAGRRERMLQMLWQAVGYEITFDAETPR
jgi:vacuolar-type H+-ATPase subunit F/Vma7